MSDGRLGSVDWEGCSDCIHRDDSKAGCKVGGPDVEIDWGEYFVCSIWKLGDPPTEEEIEAEEARKRFEELDQYQEKIFTGELST